MEEGEFAVITLANGKTVRARNVILATNAYSSKLGYLRRAVTPVFDYVAVTAPLQAERLARDRLESSDSLQRLAHRSFLPRPDQKTIACILGGGHVDYVFNNGLAEPVQLERRFTALREELGRIYPGLASEPFEVCWSGAVDMSLDQTPSVANSENMTISSTRLAFPGTGCKSHFGLRSNLSGPGSRKTAEWAWLPYLNRLPLYTPNEPFRWAGVQAAFGYYRMTDPK